MNWYPRLKNHITICTLVDRFSFYERCYNSHVSYYLLPDLPHYLRHFRCPITTWRGGGEQPLALYSQYMAVYLVLPPSSGPLRLAAPHRMRASTLWGDAAPLATGLDQVKPEVGKRQPRRGGPRVSLGTQTSDVLPGYPRVAQYLIPCRSHGCWDKSRKRARKKRRKWSSPLTIAELRGLIGDLGC